MKPRLGRIIPASKSQSRPSLERIIRIKEEKEKNPAEGLFPASGGRASHGTGSRWADARSHIQGTMKCCSRKQTTQEADLQRPGLSDLISPPPASPDPVFELKLVQLREIELYTVGCCHPFTKKKGRKEEEIMK